MSLDVSVFGRAHRPQRFWASSHDDPEQGIELAERHLDFDPPDVFARAFVTKEALSPLGWIVAARRALAQHFDTFDEPEIVDARSKERALLLAETRIAQIRRGEFSNFTASAVRGAAIVGATGEPKRERR
jgi:hypothetical protein